MSRSMAPGRPFPAQLWRGGWRMKTTTWGYDLVGANHYAVRSAESFLVKRERGRANHVDRDQGTADWFRMNHNVVEDRNIRQFDQPTANEKDRLRALPGFAEAHEASVAWHRQRIAHHLSKDVWRAFLRHHCRTAHGETVSAHPKIRIARIFEGPMCVPDDLVDRSPGERFFFTV